MHKPHNISQNEFENLERYILNRMEQDEKLSFEAKLNSESALSEKLTEIKDLLKGIEEADLRDKIEKFHQDFEKDKMTHKTRKRFFLSGRLAVAASVLIVMVISAYLLLRPDRNQRLYATFYQPDPGLVTAMSVSNSDYEFDRGMVDFKIRNYEAAIERWKPLVSKAPENDTLNYFMGVAHLALKQSSEAITGLKMCSENPQSRFANDAWWYLALAYVLEENKSEAIGALEHTNHPGKEALLHKIKHE